MALANFIGKATFASNSKSQIISPKASQLPVSGATLWLDANVGLYDSAEGGSLVVSDGSSIGRWEDQSGNNFHLIQTNTNSRPTLRTNTENNLNAISFDGSNDMLSNLYEGFDIGLNHLASFVVFKQMARGGVSSQFIHGNSRFNSFLGYTFAINSSGFPLLYYNTDQVYTKLYAGSVLLNNPYLFTMHVNRANREFMVKRNGIYDSNLSSITTLNSAEASFNAIAQRPIETGASLYTSISRAFNGHVYEIVTYITEEPLTSEQVISVEQHLINKWGI